MCFYFNYNVEISQYNVFPLKILLLFFCFVIMVEVNFVKKLIKLINILAIFKREIYFYSNFVKLECKEDKGSRCILKNI